MRAWRFALPLLVFVVLLGFLSVGLNLKPREVPSPLIGKAAPSFSLPRLEDAAQQVRQQDLLGRVWVLNVFASWCTPCLEEHPLLLDFSKRNTTPLLGLNYKDPSAAAQAWLQRHGNPYTVVAADSLGKVGIDFGVYGVPETFVIDKQGVIRFKHIGPLTPEVMREKIEPLLRQLNA